MFRQRLVWVPTPLGLLVITALAVGGAGICAWQLHPFLAPIEPLATDVFVVEGWLPKDALWEFGRRLGRQPHGHLYTTGGPIDAPWPDHGYGNHASLSAAALASIGLEPSRITAVPAPASQRQRTRTAALALQRWLALHHPNLRSFNLVSLGPHARRSWTLYKEVFCDQSEIGIIAMKPTAYDPDRWWSSSAGTRAVLSEALALAYETLAR